MRSFAGPLFAIRILFTKRAAQFILRTWATLRFGASSLALGPQCKVSGAKKRPAQRRAGRIYAVVGGFRRFAFFASSMAR